MTINIILSRKRRRERQREYERDREAKRQREKERERSHGPWSGTISLCDRIYFADPGKLDTTGITIDVSNKKTGPSTYIKEFNKLLDKQGS